MFIMNVVKVMGIVNGEHEGMTQAVMALADRYM